MLQFICFLINTSYPFFFAEPLFFYGSKRLIGFALAFVARILEIFHKGKTQRMYKCTQARHGDIQSMPEYENQTAQQPANYGAGRVVDHKSNLVEHATQHAACQT